MNFFHLRPISIFLLFLTLSTFCIRAAGLDVEKYCELVKNAKEKNPVADSLTMYPTIPAKTQATLVTRVDDKDTSEKLSVSRMVTADGQLVLRYSSDHPSGEHSTDIISYNEKSGIYQRVRLLANGDVEVLNGLKSFSPENRTLKKDKNESASMVWTGHVERAGQPTDIKVIATEYVLNLDLPTYKNFVITWSHHRLQEDRILQKQAFHFDSIQAEKIDMDLERKPRGLGGLLQSVFGKSPDKKPPTVKEDDKPMVYEFEKLNFRFKRPEGKYERMNEKVVSSAAALTLLQAEPNRMIMIVAEEIEQTLPINTYAEIIRTNLRSGRTKATVGEAESIILNGVEYRIFQTVEKSGDHTNEWCHLLSQQNGFFYQLVLFSHHARGEKINLKSDLQQLAKNFTLIDPNRKAKNTSALVFVYEDAAFGVSADAQRINAIPWDKKDMVNHYPYASWGAITQDKSGFFIMPIDLSGLVVPPDELERISLSLLGITKETHEIKTSSHAQGSGKGKKFTIYENEAANPFTQQLRLLLQGDKAIIIAAFTGGRGEKQNALLDRLLDHVTIRATLGKNSIADATNQAGMINFFGLDFHNRGQYREAMAYFEEAHRRNPANPIYRSNQLKAINGAGLGEKGLELVKKMLAEATGPQVELKAWQASFLADVGQNDESISIYSSLFADGWRSDDDFLRLLGIMIQDDRLDEAVTMSNEYVKRHSITALRVLRWQRQIHSQTGKWDSAVDLAQALCKQNPDDASLRLELAMVLIDAEKADDAMKLLDEGKFGGISEALVLHQRGRALMQNRKFTEAKECLERAVKQLPENQEISSDLARTSAMLGQGDQNSIRSELVPVSIPPEIQTTGQAKNLHSDGFPFRVESNFTGYYFAYNQPYKRSEYKEVTILTRAGVDQYKDIQFRFDPSYEMAYINTLEVFDSEGKVKAKGDPEDYFVSGDSGGPVMASGERTVTAPIPGLAVGDSVRIIYTIQSKAPAKELPFSRHIFASMIPSGTRSVFVTGEIDKIRGIFHLGEAIQKEGNGFRSWLVPSPHRFDYETMLPDADRFLPSLTIGPAIGNWKEIVAEYLTSQQDRLTASPEIIEQAKKFVAEHPHTEARTKAIIRFVQLEITYQAMLFGTRARTPKRAERCLADRYGDCKDHSLLAHLLLKEAGIESQLVLIDPSSQLIPSIPSMDQFNHMIIRVGNRSHGRFFDCTADNIDAALGAESNYANRDCLVLYNDEAQIETIKKTTAYESKLVTERKVSYHFEKNEFIVEESAQFHGDQAEWVRANFVGVDRSQYVDLLTRMLGADQGLKIDDVKISGLAIIDSYVQIDLKYRITTALDADGKVRSGYVPSVWEEVFFKVGAHAKRKSPFQIRSAYTFESRCEIVSKMDKSVVLDADVWGSAKSEKSWGKWQVEVDGNRMHATAQWNPEIYPASDFDSYLGQQNQFLKSVRGKFSVTND